MFSKLTNTIRLGIALVVIIWAAIVVYLWMYGPGYKGNCILPGCRDTDTGEKSSFLNSSKLFKSKNITPVHVCIAGEETTLGGMIAAINSIRSNAKGRVMFHLVTDQKSEQHLRDWIGKTSLASVLYEIKVFPEEWLKDKIKVKGARPELASPMNFARFYIPRLFPNLRGTVVYIDDDSVVQGDISQLVKSVHFKDGQVAAVSDDCTAMSKRFSVRKNFYMHYINFEHKAVIKMAIPKTTCSFNTGVFVFDVDRWNAFGITENLEKWMKLNYKENVFGNEKAGGTVSVPMMLALYNKTVQLDPSWNVRFLGTSSTMKKYSILFLTSAKLLHWSGPEKPWMGKSPYVELWEKWYIPDPTKKFRLVRKSAKV